MATFDNLKLLIGSLKNIGFWDRIFGWKRITNLMIDAAGELAASEAKLNDQDIKINTLSGEKQLLIQEKEALLLRKQEIEKERDHIKLAADIIQKESDNLKKENTTYKAIEEARKNKHEESLSTLDKIETRILNERAKELEDRTNTELQRLAALKDTWLNHENTVKGTIRTIAQRHTVDYVEKVPFKGAPDNTLYICDEFIVFDAKSPGGEELKNFPSYIKDQAERATKYAKQPDVKSDIFFIVPSNTLEILRQFVYKFADYTVFVMGTDALEPVILSLKKIEEYEFAKELTPEDRNNICRILGRFAHLSKRRIQIDSFFAKQFIELAYKAESSLPPDILESVMEFEKAEKLNPPMEKRTKAIPTGELEKEISKINQDADGRGIKMEDEQLSDKINDHPLYKSNT